MYSLASFISGGAIVALAVELVAAPAGTNFGLMLSTAGTPRPPVSFAQRFAATTSTILPQFTTQTIDRSGKGPRLAPARPAETPPGVVASVEKLGGRSPAVIYRTANGQVVFLSDPAVVSTVAVKNVSLRDVTAPEAGAPVYVKRAAPIRANDRAREEITKAPVSPAKTPTGCSPAYSPLSRAAPTHFTGRCVVENLAAPIHRAIV